MPATNRLNILEPRDGKVVQRTGPTTGQITITGTANFASPVSIEADWGGGGYATIASNVTTGTWTGTLTGLGVGRGDLTIRIVTDTSNSYTVSSVGIGDVYGVWGQSLACGYGNNPQTWSHATLIASMMRHDYQYRTLADPLSDDTNIPWPEVVTDTKKGSAWPIVADAFLADQGVPIMFIMCASGGTSITQWLPGADHLDRSTLYGAANYRCQLAGGTKAILWWQGEADAGMASETYNAHLDTLAAAIQSDLGCPIIPCKLEDFTAWNATGPGNVNAAIGTAWADNPNVLQGPDFSDIAPADSDGVHIVTDAQLATCGARWWTALQTLFYT